MHNKEIIGLIPAAGTARRISPLPCSKELFPIGLHTPHQDCGSRPKVVCHYLLEKMRFAGVTKTFIILREGKWDIPAYLGDGKMLDMHLAYLMMDLPFGVPFTLDQAYPFVKTSIVAFGFPDIIFEPNNAYLKLLERQSESFADLVLGLFPAYKPHKMDMVDLDINGRIREILIKPDKTHLRYTWIIAVWTSTFTNFMHEFVMNTLEVTNKNKTSTIVRDNEIYFGDIIQGAIQEKMDIQTVFFKGGTYLDIGTPEDMAKAFKFYNKY